MEVMKKCKECGKLFKPDNPRQRYCTDVHYRPCPTCGKPVEIKYLSDPTPRCLDCRRSGNRVNPNKSTPAPIVDEAAASTLPDDFVERVYKGRDNQCGFHTGHKYLVKVKSNRPYGFIVEAIKDLTTNEDLDDVSLPIASYNSFDYFFKER